MLQMPETLYYFPKQLEDVAYASGIDKVSAAIVEGDPEEYEEIDSPYFSKGIAHDLDTDEYIKQYIEQSALYSKLTIEERLIVQAIVKHEKPEWRIKGEDKDNTNRLFPVDKRLGTIACSEMDIVTLSGAGSYALEEAKFTEIFDKFAEFGFKNRLDFMVFASAWFGNRARESIGCRISLAVDPRPDGLLRQVMLGGDVHGGFRLARISTSKKGAIGPGSLHVGFSPFIHEQVAAYHSTEQTIVTAIGAHLLKINMPIEEKITLIKELLEKHPTADQEHGQSFYGDFGTNSEEEPWQIAHELSLMVGRETRLTSLLVTPVNRDLSLELESHPDAFTMSNNYSDQTIDFKKDELQDLLRSFSNIGDTKTRTSGATIGNVLSVVLLVLETIQSNATASVSQVCEQVAQTLSERDV